MSAEKKITRKDVAEKAGVSVSVVSRVLNNSGYVDKEKKKKIIKIAEQLGYIPNPIAMALQTRRTWINALMPVVIILVGIRLQIPAHLTTHSAKS